VPAMLSLSRTDRLELAAGQRRQLWYLSKSDWKLTFFTVSCETFLSPSACAVLITVLYKFYHCFASYCIIVISNTVRIAIETASVLGQNVLLEILHF